MLFRFTYYRFEFMLVVLTTNSYPLHVISLNEFMLWFTYTSSCYVVKLCSDRANPHAHIPGRAAVYAAPVGLALLRLNNDLSK